MFQENLKIYNLIVSRTTMAKKVNIEFYYY